MASISNMGHGTGVQLLAGPALRLARTLREEWAKRRTERVLAGLPAVIRKDIGWPTRDMPASKNFRCG